MIMFVSAGVLSSLFLRVTPEVRSSRGSLGRLPEVRLMYCCFGCLLSIQGDMK